MIDRLKKLHEEIRLSCFDDNGMFGEWSDNLADQPAALTRRELLLILEELQQLRGFASRIRGSLSEG